MLVDIFPHETCGNQKEQEKGCIKLCTSLPPQSKVAPPLAIWSVNNNQWVSEFACVCFRGYDNINVDKLLLLMLYSLPEYVV